MAALISFVHVTDKKGQTFVFGPGDDVPAWAQKLITNEKAWDEAPTTAPERAEGEPPRNGAGSGLDEWKTYAASLDIEVPDDANREAVIALVDAKKNEQ
jgi:hypothetical protein